jgi:hypothetical protein
VRRLVWVLLIVLALASVIAGRLEVALALAGVKALLVGAQFMELRHAHRAHAAAFAAWVLTLVAVLELLARS